MLNTAVLAGVQETKMAQAYGEPVLYSVEAVAQVVLVSVLTVLVVKRVHGGSIPMAAAVTLVLREAEQAETATLEAMVVETVVAEVEQEVLVKKEEMAAWEVLQAGVEEAEPPRILAMVALVVMVAMAQSGFLVFEVNHG